MQDYAARIREVMARERLSQESLAKRAGVSQATVCRALKGQLIRGGGATEKLFTYLGLDEYLVEVGSVDPKTRMAHALSQIWDGSNEHAAIIVRLLEALAEFSIRRRNHGRPSN